MRHRLIDFSFRVTAFVLTVGVLASCSSAPISDEEAQILERKMEAYQLRGEPPVMNNR